ncbi:hypothetical protein SDRG_12539 [Saprolegnia diclina VS20]|uniref:RING-type E3 ubiquitin transferase n=1 Tax=Saprolegnia diclina (strain VS20) TaxID=1156394 RepID=T0RC26_SAPDV|nr:hypothetical protein SDRG_12539 [Saprolegnia diclina VS20]EQC29768.1 hypothetical protein SDRG_12539 [Saprolegnia diclina VS20]|eukprot:XP_008616834.1 hypothetical protein SDRG_12539 [Saprolegnia diclina VS20]
MPLGSAKFSRAAYDAHVQGLVHRRLNPISTYVEYTLVEDLTPYDLFRAPRPVTTAAPLDVPVTELDAELTCPICLGVLQQTTVVPACLHRFCRGCIDACLASGKHECPSCRAGIPTKRALRADTAFDALVRLLHPPPPLLSPSKKRATPYDLTEATTLAVTFALLGATTPSQLQWTTTLAATVHEANEWLRQQLHGPATVCTTDGAALSMASLWTHRPSTMRSTTARPRVRMRRPNYLNTQSIVTAYLAPLGRSYQLDTLQCRIPFSPSTVIG